MISYAYLWFYVANTWEMLNGLFCCEPIRRDESSKKSRGVCPPSSFGEARFENFTMRAHSARIVFNLTVLFLDGMMRSDEWAL